MIVIERIGSDAGDRIAIGRAGDDHRADRPSIASDGDGAVVGGESELGLHHGG